MKLTYIDAYYYKLLLQAGFEKEVNDWINNIAENNKVLEDIYLELACNLGDKYAVVSVLNEYILEKEIDCEVVCTKLRLFLRNMFNNFELNIEGIAAACYIFGSEIECINFESAQSFLIIGNYYDLVSEEHLEKERYTSLVLNYLETGEKLYSEDFWQKEQSRFKTFINMQKRMLSPLAFKINYIFIPIISFLMLVLIAIITIMLSIDETRYLIPAIILFGLFWTLFVTIFILLFIIRKQSIKEELSKYNFELTDNAIDNYYINSLDGVSFNFTKEGIETYNKIFSYGDFCISVHGTNYLNEVLIYVEFVLLNDNENSCPYWNFRLTNELYNAIVKFNIPICNKDELKYIVSNKDKALIKIFKK